MEYPEPAPNHYLIGLTGNIGSGKSMVRKMLEHLGALGMDADWLTRLASNPGAPGYAPILARFGREILDESGEIDRRRLGRLVFSDPAALASLEAILHPLASAATANILKRSPLPVVVIEAIKVLESDLAEQCQSIWVVTADPQAVFARLEKSRGMSHADVEARLAQQSPLSEKMRRADVVIDNSGSLPATWQQVQAAWNTLSKPVWDAAAFQALKDGVSLLPPNANSLRQIQAFLRTHARSLPAAYLAAQSRQGQPVKAGDLWMEDEETLFRYLLRFYFSAASAQELAVWSMESFACQLGAYHFMAEQSMTGLEVLIKGMEKLAQTYLCRQICLPARAEYEPLLLGMGYDKQADMHACPELYKKAGYNLYNKTFPSLLKVF